MQKLRRLPRTCVGINMTPMIDVVFLLIIFFLVSSHLARRETRIPVNLPSASGGQTDLVDASPRLTLTLQEGGRLWLGSQQVSMQQLSQRLQSHHQEHGELVALRIRCDRRLPYQEVERVLAGAARVGIWNVSFAVLEATGSPR